MYLLKIKQKVDIAFQLFTDKHVVFLAPAYLNI